MLFQAFPYFPDNQPEMYSRNPEFCLLQEYWIAGTHDVAIYYKL